MRQFTYTCVLLLVILSMSACSSIQPMTLPPYSPPDFSNVARPTIPPLIEGQDYQIDEQANKVIFTIEGLNKVTAKVISEQTAYQIIDMMKQTIQVQGELIKQKDQLLIAVDLQRQYAEKAKTNAEIKMYAAEIISVIVMIAITVAAF